MSQKSRRVFLAKEFLSYGASTGRWYPYKIHGWEGLKSWSPNSRIQWVRNGPGLLEIDYYNRKPESGKYIKSSPKV